jgi:hypothetical protein
MVVIMHPPVPFGKSHQSNKDKIMNQWVESDWYQNWLKLSHNRPKEKDVGYWVYDSQQCKWIFIDHE